MGIFLVHDQDVGGLGHGVGQVAVEVELGADRHVRADNLAHPGQQVALAVVAALGDQVRAGLDVVTDGEQTRFLAYHDPLTRLPNREFFREQLAEAIKDALEKLSGDEVKVGVISSGVGAITESDVQLAAASKAIVIGFNVRADASARDALKETGVDVRYYSIVYEAIDDVKAAVSGLLTPEFREEIFGLAEVREVFRSQNVGNVAGCMVVDGFVKRSNPIRVLRDNVVIFEGELESLRRFKDDVTDVRAGTECGIGVKNYNDVKVGDQIECYERKEISRTI